MRILYCTTDIDTKSGWGTYGYNIVTEAQKNGYETHVLVCSAVRETEGVHQYPVLSDPLRILVSPLRIWKEWVTIRSYIDQIQPDCIHVLAEPYIMPFIFMRTHRPVVLSCHGTYATLPKTVVRWTHRLLSHFLYEYAQHIVSGYIFVSESTKRRFAAYFGTPTVSVHVIHNSFSAPEFLGREKDASTDAYSVITIGMVKRRKGIHDAIRLLRSWSDETKSKVIYHVVGASEETSPYAKEVRILAEHYASPLFQIVFHGVVTEEEKRTLLRSAQLYIHLECVTNTFADAEGFGIGIIEAAAYGVPALVGRGSATTEAVVDGETGYVVDIDNTTAVHEALTALLHRNIITERALCAWARAHAPEKQFQEINAVYHSLTQKNAVEK